MRSSWTGRPVDDGSEGGKTMSFTRATKKRSKLRLALTGPSGSGKTYSALRLAKGIGGRIAVIDTESGSASLYADLFDFDVMELSKPFTPEKYTAAIKEATAAGYDVLIIDSLTHAWAGEGGVLESVDDAASRIENKFAAWGPATKRQNHFIGSILDAEIHIIATMRSKMEYALENNAKGKAVPKKIGMAPVQRDGVEYEFATVLDVGMDHFAGVGLVGKDRTGIFEGRDREQLTEEDGRRILAWLTETPAANGTPSGPDPWPAKLLERISAAETRMGLRMGELLDHLQETVTMPARLTDWPADYGHLFAAAVKVFEDSRVPTIPVEQPVEEESEIMDPFKR
jgi:hypothetical protein